MGIRGSQQVAWEQRQQRKNREAEEAYVRKNVWGSDETASDDDMGDTIYLGDIKEEHHHEPTRKSKTGSIAKTLAAAGLAAAGLGAGTALPILAYNMTKPSTPSVVVEQPATGIDTDTKYGLQIYRDK